LQRIFGAIVAGALAGEVLLITIDPSGDRNDALAIAGRVVRSALVAGSACGIMYLWQRSEATAALNHSQEMRRLRAERILARLRIEALQRQIEPHFLFNTFATIRRLQRSDPTHGQALLSRFFEFLRGSLDVAGGETLLRDELEIAAAYLDICSVRLSGALRWHIDVPEELKQQPFPRFGLSTLLENAVKHGIVPSPDGGDIRISARRLDGALELAVEDTGAGFSDEHGTGVGLANIREQLTLRYGNSASLSLTSNRPRGVRAVIRIPLERMA
jgi:LytS/YehU family sensor histidine kinase